MINNNLKRTSVHIMISVLTILLTSVCAMQNVSALTNETVDYDDWWPKWLRRLTGAEETFQNRQGFEQGRQQELEKMSYGLGAGLAILILICLIIWGMTAYAVWRLRKIRRERAMGLPIHSMATPMTSQVVPMVSPRALPSGPKLVSQKIIGAAPNGFQTSPIRLA